MRTEQLLGRDVLHRLGADLDDLHSTTDTPLTARRPWLQSWVESHPHDVPVAVVLVSDGGRLDAAALLAVRHGRVLDLIVALGDGPSDAAMFPARDAGAAELLAEAVARELESRRRGWQLQARHVVPQDLVAPRLAARLPRARLVSGDLSPAMRIAADASLRAHVSKRHPANIRRIRNRMTRHGLAPEVEHVTSSPDVTSLLPEMEQVCRARDESLGRRSELDDPSGRSFFRRVIEVHAARGEVCVTTLTLNGALAAYVLCFLDGDASRMWNCRFDPRWSKYSPGKLAMDEAVEHAVARGYREFDFMRGEEPYKESYANTQMAASDLFAWSGRVSQTRGVGFLEARRLARRMESAGGRPAAVVALAKRLRSRGGAS